MLEISLDSYDHDSSIPHKHAFCDISEDLKTAHDDCCPVCLEDDSPDTMLLPCSHEFHGECNFFFFVLYNFFACFSEVS